MDEIEEATIKVVVGTEKKSRVMSEREKKLTAYHEAGHAIATYYCETQDRCTRSPSSPGMAGATPCTCPPRTAATRAGMKCGKSWWCCWAAVCRGFGAG